MEKGGNILNPQGCLGEIDKVKGMDTRADNINQCVSKTKE